MKEMSDLIYGKAAVGGNYNSTRDSISSGKILFDTASGTQVLFAGFCGGYTDS